jgi:hypothetical protein
VRDRLACRTLRRRDADAAFGLAYAHAEDDFLSIQRAVLTARGRLATVDGVRAVDDDYLVQLLGIWDDIDARYETELSSETRALLDGYAAGLNLYAAQHRGDVLTGFARRKRKTSWRCSCCGFRSSTASTINCARSLRAAPPRLPAKWPKSAGSRSLWRRRVRPTGRPGS